MMPGAESYRRALDAINGACENDERSTRVIENSDQKGRARGGFRK